MIEELTKRGIHQDGADEFWKNARALTGRISALVNRLNELGMFMPAMVGNADARLLWSSPRKGEPPYALSVWAVDHDGKPGSGPADPSYFPSAAVLAAPLIADLLARLAEHMNATRLALGLLSIEGDVKP